MGQGISGIINIGGPNIQAIHQPGEVMAAMEIGPSHMPRFAYLLSVSQMHDIANYVTQSLAVIDLPQGDIAKGGALFRVNCAPCHRTAVRGGALAFTGVNAPSLVGMSRGIIAGAVRWGPGPMPVFSSAQIDDKELSSIAEYAKFAEHPPSPGGDPLNWYGPVAEGLSAWVIMLGIVGAAWWIEKGGKG